MWITLTVSRLQAKMLSTEYDKLSAVGVPADTTWSDVINAELAAIVRKVRGYCPTNTPRADGDTIPDELEDSALAIARVQFFTRFPSLKQLLTDARLKEYDEALRLLERWSNGKFNVVPPPADEEAPAEEQASGPGAELLTSRKRRYTRSSLNGL